MEHRPPQRYCHLTGLPLNTGLGPWSIARPGDKPGPRGGERTEVDRRKTKAQKLSRRRNRTRR